MSYMKEIYNDSRPEKTMSEAQSRSSASGCNSISAETSSPDGRFSHALSGLRKSIEEQEQLLEILISRASGFLRPAVEKDEPVKLNANCEVKSSAVEAIDGSAAHLRRNTDKINYILNYLES